MAFSTPSPSPSSTPVSTPVSLLSQFSEKVILRVYGSKYMVVISPVFAIDKVRISIVELGTNGKNSSDIFLTTEEFFIFCNEIDNFIAKKKIDADKNDYPTAYQWVKGENGCKKLSIGGGQKGVRIMTQIRTEGQIDRKMAVIQYSDLQKMSAAYRLVSGLTLCQKGSYYASLYNAFWSQPEYKKVERNGVV